MNARGKMNAWFLHAADRAMDRLYGSRKRAIYGELPDTVVEIGPGAGANFRYYPPGTRVIAVEPNPAMHPRLRAKARRRRIDLQIWQTGGEAIPLPDASVPAVVCTLVLCTAQDPAQVVSEVRRILVPGGRFIFLEHVAALSGTRLRGAQEILYRPWRWLFEGCHLNRQTQQVIADAGFSHLDMDCFVMDRAWLPFAPHIFGVAVN